VKWSFLPEEREITYLCVNADESEPPTFSNRVLMEHDPHQLIEGILISAYATRTTIAYLYMRAEFTEQFHIMQRRSTKRTQPVCSARTFSVAGTTWSATSIRGGGAYVCGEEPD
jgi:NADH-quinone oxidoreductase subunit F